MRRWLVTACVCYSICVLLLPVHADDIVCHPAITGVQYGTNIDSIVTGRLATLLVEDQAIREPKPGEEFDIEKMIAEDEARRDEVLGYLQQGKVVLNHDLFTVALIFQHGNCPEHYALAAELSQRAFESGYLNAGWLYTAATDRYLQSIGELQDYGTQYVTGLDAHFALCPVSDKITDIDRRKYGLPSLDALEKRTTELDASYQPQPGRFAFVAQIPGMGDIFNRAYVRTLCNHA